MRQSFKYGDSEGQLKRAVIMNRVGVLLLVSLTAHLVTQPTTTECTCGAKDVTDAEKEDVQMYLPNNKNQQETSSGEQDLSALQIPLTLENTHSETGDQVASDVDRPSTQATIPLQKLLTSTASSGETCLPPTGEQKISNLPTVPTLTIAYSNAGEQELTNFPTDTTQATASSNDRELELTTSPTDTPQAITPSHATGQEMTAFPTFAPQTTPSFQSNEQEEFASTQTKILASTGGQEFSSTPSFTSQATPTSLDGEQESSDSRTPLSRIKSTLSSINLRTSDTMIAYKVLIGCVGLFFVFVILKYFVSRFTWTSSRNEASYGIEDDYDPNQFLTSFPRDDYGNSYQDDHAEQMEMTTFRPQQVPPSGSDEHSGVQRKSSTL